MEYNFLTADRGIGTPLSHVSIDSAHISAMSSESGSASRSFFVIAKYFMNPSDRPNF